MRLLILAHGGEWDRRYQVSALASSAVAAGDRVDVALFFGALEAWARGGWDRLDPAPPVEPGRLVSLDFPPLSDLLAAGREDGCLHLYACSASARILGLDPTGLQSRVDAVCGWQTFAKLIAQADRVVTF